jgi:hypothetical protein
MNMFVNGKLASYSSPALNDGPAATLDRRIPKAIAPLA